MVSACHGIGRAPNQFMLVGSAPGWREMQGGKPFIGPTGEEVDRLLQLIGFPRPLWFLTNFFRRPAPRIDNKEMPRPGEDYEEAGHHLKEELTRVQPKLIVPLGREAIRYFLGEVDVDECWGLHLKPPSGVLERLPMLRADVTIAPQVHPAAGFHSPEASNQVLRGFELLARILKGKTPARYLYDDPIPEPDYRELFTADEFYAWANDYAAMLEVANDTEGSPRFPWSTQLTKSDGEGIILRTPAAMGAMHEWARETKPLMTFHNALYDVRMNRVQGLDIFEEGIPFDDTQLMAYELGVIPQGLKALAVRECAMPMLGYMEVLGDAQDRHAVHYLQDIWNTLNVDHQRLRQWDFEFQTKVKGRRIKKLPTIPKPDLMKTAERVLSSKTPARLWLDQTDDRQVEAFGLMRYEMPEASLSDVDPEIAIRYAGRDPDATRRVKKVLMPRLQEMGLEDVYRLDLATLPILDRMMSVGMLPDHDAFARLALVLDDEIDELRRKLIADTGINNFNPNSGDQTASYIFDNLGLDMLGKRTDSGRGSTNDKVLEALEKMYPEYGAVADIRRYREFYKLRWTFCLAPETKVLGRDLIWRPAAALAAGDDLLGFDEIGKSGTRKSRQWQPSRIKAVERRRAQCVRLTLENGERLTCSADHKWLASSSEKGRLEWVRAGDMIRRGNAWRNWEIAKPLDVWTQDESWLGGRLSGLYDGEGSLSLPKLRIDFTQNPGRVLNDVREYLGRYRYPFCESGRESDATHLTICTAAEVLRFLGTIRPVRLLDKFERLRQPLSGCNMARRIRVVCVDAIGEQDVISIETETRTFVAEGFASHNCERLPELVDRWPFDGRIHCELMLTRTPSGRLAAKSPNLLAMPKHGKYAKLFRACFVPREGCMFLSLDESQIELRVGAHLSQDPVMLAIYRGEMRNPDGSRIDLHTNMCKRMLGRAEETSGERTAAKAVNFGYWMGQTYVGLKLELQKAGLDVSDHEAQGWIDAANDLYKGAVTYKEAMIQEATRNGYIRCPLSGRIRYVGGIRSRDDRVRAEAERFAYSTPIQEGAQALAKRMLAEAWTDVFQPARRAGQHIEPLLWTHDDLLSEVEIPQVLRVARELKAIMVKTPQGFSVPLDTTPEAGLTWADLTELGI